MSTRPRVRLPEQAKAGEIIEIKTLVTHVMETGQRRGPDGQMVPRDIIHTFTASFAGQEVFRAMLHPATSANPYIAFFMKVPGPGELELVWTDDAGKRIVEKVRLNVVG